MNVHRTLALSAAERGVDKTNSFYCHCSNGFSGERCQTDINECVSNPCHPTNSVQCVDEINGFHCDCVPGFSGVRCQTEIDECASNPCGWRDLYRRS